MKLLINTLKEKLLPVLLLCSLFFTTTQAADFAYGADIGWLKQLEDEGVSWMDDSGNMADPLAILANHGIDSVRLRIFVNPDASAYWFKDNTTWTMLGYTDKNSVIAAAQRAQALGLRVMVDFHYSDVFADPGHQIKPAAWENYSTAQLVTAVYDHTYEVMTALVNAGVTPEWVQVGNEMNSGILLPEGGTSNFASLTQMLNAGYDAVKAVSSSSKVVSHIANGSDNGNSRWFFDNFLTNHGGKTDVIGFSFYPYWEGTGYWNLMSDLQANLNDVAATYGKEVMIVEVGGLETDAHNSYWTVLETINVVKSVPNNMGTGVFYWEPAAHSSVLPDGYPLGTTTEVSGNVLQFTTALDAFQDANTGNPSSGTFRIINRNSGKALNVQNSSTSDGALIEQYTYNGWDSQHWLINDLGNGFVEIESVASGKVLDIEAASTANGANNIQWTAHGGWNQQWQLVDAGSGYTNIVNRNSGLFLDIEARSLLDGGLNIQWPDNGGYNQEWQIIEN